MSKRGVTFTERKLAKLKDYEFKMNLVVDNFTAANIQPKIGSCVYGALYTCTSDCLDILDKFEMVEQGVYKRLNVKVELQDGKVQDTVLYIGLPPFIDDSARTVKRFYLDHILCDRNILPSDYTKTLEAFLSWCKD